MSRSRLVSASLSLGFLFLLCLLCLIVSSSYFSGTSPWLRWGFVPAHSVAWCERDRETELMREWANSWSDVAFLAVALCIAALAMDDAERQHSSIPPLLSFTFALLNVLHFVGTMWNHSCHSCVTGHVLDVSGMIAVTSFPIIVWLYDSHVDHLFINNMERENIAGRRLVGAAERGEVEKRCVSIWIGCYLITLFVNLRFNLLHGIAVDLSMVVICFVILFAFYYLIFARSQQFVYNLTYLYATVALFAVGAILQRVDQIPYVCQHFIGPDNWAQGHAAWHILTALAIFTMYALFRSKRDKRAM